MSVKLVTLWIVGAFFLFVAVFIIRHLEMVIGVTPFSYYMTLAIAFLLILITGLCWISVGAASRR